MAGEAFIKGDTVLLEVWDTDAYEPIACLTSNTIDENINFDERQTKCDPGNIIATPITYQAELSFDATSIDESVDTGRQSHGKLKLLARNFTRTTIRLGTGLASPNQYEYVSGYFSNISQAAEAGALLTFSGSFRVLGKPSSTDPNA